MLEKAADIDELSKLENQLASLEGQISALREALNKRKMEVFLLAQVFIFVFLYICC